MDELLDEKQELKNKRGKTLPVLCVLSWIAIGLSFLSIGNQVRTGRSSADELRQEQYELLKIRLTNQK